MCWAVHKKNRLVHWLSCNTVIDISCFLKNGLTRLLLPAEVLCPAKPCWKKDFARRLINIEIWWERERSSQTAEKILFSASAMLCQYIVFLLSTGSEVYSTEMVMCARRLITTISRPLKIGTNAGLKKKMTRCPLNLDYSWPFTPEPNLDLRAQLFKSHMWPNSVHWSLILSG